MDERVAKTDEVIPLEDMREELNSVLDRDGVCTDEVIT